MEYKVSNKVDSQTIEGKAEGALFFIFISMSVCARIQPYLGHGEAPMVRFKASLTALGPTGYEDSSPLPSERIDPYN